jgi:hypothetical protein
MTMQLVRSRKVLLALLLGAALSLPNTALADEGGVSLWIPGFFGSLSAAPVQPGWSVATIYYHTSVDAGGNVAFARQVSRGDITVNFTGNLKAVLNADADIIFQSLGYTFKSKVLGGQFTVGAILPFGRATGSVSATVIGSGPLGLSVSGSASDEVTGFGDAAPIAQLRWNNGVHNYTTYITGNVPIGSYEAKRLANLGLGHVALDGGLGYTYLNPKTGYEFSTVLGLTYNFENQHTDYQNGVDMHVDWGASKFLTKQLHVGLVGYAYQQITGDSGAGNRLGGFESRVFGIGPQIGYVFPLGNGTEGYLNLKGYREFGAENRAEGWNTWLTFSISAAPPHRQ